MSFHQSVHPFHGRMSSWRVHIFASPHCGCPFGRRPQCPRLDLVRPVVCGGLCHVHSETFSAALKRRRRHNRDGFSHSGHFAALRNLISLCAAAFPPLRCEFKVNHPARGANQSAEFDSAGEQQQRIRCAFAYLLHSNQIAYSLNLINSTNSVEPY